MILKQVIHYPDTNSVEATWVDADGNQVKCHSYADVQMAELRADLGADVAEYETLIATVESNIKPHSAQTAEEILAIKKAERQQEVSNIKVTVGGVVFDGDEVAQGRMARAALAMTDTDTLPWVIADGTIVTVTKKELLEVLRQAGAAMAAIWIKPYQ